ncbi:MAG: ABC transporter substrate-binding protein [Firmicutes bacterium]|nr:ABC transporter substrate-binding protein [Bacillota bacterium]
MQKKMLRVVTMVLIMLMTASLFTACANNDETYVRGGEPVNEVLIGMIGPLTGGVSQFGQAVQRGVNLYIDQHNARGGLQINIVTHDDEGQAAAAAIGFDRLLDQGVTAIIGGVTSGPTRAIVPLAFEANMPMITGTATHFNVTVSEDGQVFTNMFRACFIDPFQGQRMAEFADSILGARTAAVLYSNEIDYSIGLMEAFIARANQLGIEIVEVQRFADDALDFRSQLSIIAGSSPDVLFVPAYYRHVGLIGPQSVEVGLPGTTFLGADGWATITDFMADSGSIEGAYFLTGFSAEADDPLVQQFIAAYRARHGEIPNMFAAQAYDAAKILIAAIEATIANTDYVPGSDQFRTALIANMATTNIYGVTGHISFDEFNNPIKSAIILQVKNGQELFWGYFPVE